MAALRKGALRRLGDRQQRPADQPVDQADETIEEGDLGNLRPLHEQQVADQQRLELFPAIRRAAQHQDHGRGGHGVDDTDQRFLRHERFASSGGGKDRRSDEREGQRNRMALRGVQAEAPEKPHRRAQRRHLRQRQVDEDHPALDHVQAEIRVDASQYEAGRERLDHHAEEFAHGVKALANCSTL